MDTRLLDVCRYTGVKATPSKSGDSRMAVCPHCTGVTLVQLNGESVLEEKAFRCSYCGQSILDGLDYEPLKFSINKAKTLLATAVEGVASGQYAVGSKATLQTAVNTASAVVVKYNPVPTQAEIDTAVTNLESAITTFNSGKVA